MSAWRPHERLAQRSLSFRQDVIFLFCSVLAGRRGVLFTTAISPSRLKRLRRGHQGKILIENDII
jgi:hypothetical protein